MKIPFVLMLVSLSILPAALVVRLRLARVRRDMAEHGRGLESGD